MQNHQYWQAHKESTAKLLRWIKLTFLDEKDEIMKALSELTAELMATADNVEKIVIATPAHVVVDPATHTVVLNSDIEALASAADIVKARIAARLPEPVIEPPAEPVPMRMVEHDQQTGLPI